MAKYLSLFLDCLSCGFVAAVLCALVGHDIPSVQCITLGVALVILYRVTDLSPAA